MTRFEAQLLKNDLAYLNEALFTSAQRNLTQEINSFVNTFEPVQKEDTPEESVSTTTKEGNNVPLGPDQLATAFVQLSNCNNMLQKSKQEQNVCEEILALARNASEALQDLYAKMEAIKDEQAMRPPPFSTERAQFLDDLNMRRREHESKLRREQDKMEEYYAKKTRESTFQNIVGLR